ncbi:MAG: cell division protein FtsZ, partial [Parvibaculum sp.]|nr:cell division protein FtsZ [Parvibaculum sp.]
KEEAPVQQQHRHEPAVTQRHARAETARSSQPGPAHAPESLSPSTEGRLVQPSYEEEQLEIPAFLRRQAN